MIINGYRVSNHLWSQAQAKGIPAPAVVAVLEQRTELHWIRVNGVGKCQRCGITKHEHNGVWVSENGHRFAIGIVVCDRCRTAITTYKANDEGCTPIRADQNIRQYQRKCADCDKKFIITARTWEKLSEQTRHKCHGRVVDLIAEDDKDKRGRYYLGK